MKIVVFGPDKRTGALHDDNVVDLSYACAKYLSERAGEASPREMAEALVPSNLARLIEGGPRALDHAQKALDYLFDQAQDKFGPTRRDVGFPDGRQFACTPRGPTMRVSPVPEGTSPITLPAMAVKIRRRPY